MGDHPELATFRRFQSLNMKSLLCMQAEILHLESELAAIESEDERSGEISRSMLHQSVFNLKASRGSLYDVQWKKVLEVRQKLEQYSKLATVQPGTTMLLSSTLVSKHSRIHAHATFTRCKNG
ncbi:MAG: hypothetical protein Q9209_005277 [Squamulea sp. 1 TL-2023]